MGSSDNEDFTDDLGGKIGVYTSSSKPDEEIVWVGISQVYSARRILQPPSGGGAPPAGGTAAPVVVAEEEETSYYNGIDIAKTTFSNDALSCDGPSYYCVRKKYTTWGKVMAIAP